MCNYDSMEKKVNVTNVGNREREISTSVVCRVTPCMQLAVVLGLISGKVGIFIFSLGWK